VATPAVFIKMREQGRYPKGLDALMPKYLEKIPHDLYTSNAVAYRPEAKGYVLYSFGPNRMRDTRVKNTSTPAVDDLIIDLRAR
jgi:hypothetical protein